MSDVSVIIPCYNASRFLAEAIDSAFAQSVEGFGVEVIVVDDGSTDDSRAIIESYGNRIEAIFQKNKGACAARNAGLAVAESEFIKFLDADDRLPSGSLHRQVGLLRSSTEDTVVYGNAARINADGISLNETYFAGSKPIGLTAFQDMVVDWLITGLPLHRRVLLDKVKGFDETLGSAQDFDLSMRLYFAGVRFRYDKSLVYEYREHESDTRISTYHHGAAEFEGRRRCYLRHAASAKKDLNTWSQAAADAFASNLWETGRYALRCKQYPEARAYFAAAREIAASRHFYGGRIYRTLCTCLGTRGSEWVLQTARNIRHTP